MLWDVIKKRVSGFSTPFFGLSWNPPSLESDVALSIINFLENRRVIYKTEPREDVNQCVNSINQIRDKLGEELENLDKDSKLRVMVKEMQASCRKFDDCIQKNNIGNNYVGALETSDSITFNTSLGELRGVFGLQIALISSGYEINISDDLAGVLPQ